MVAATSRGEIEVDLYLSRHPLWSTLVTAPPEGVRYIIRSGAWGKAYLALSGLIRLRRLAHFCNGVKLAPGRRWVADLESVKVFFRTYEEMLDPEKVASAQRRIETGECVALLPLTEAAKRTLTRFLNTRNTRVRVIYPTFHTNTQISQSPRREIVLFVGGSWRDKSFEAKGGREVAESWLRIRKNYQDYRFLMLSTPPPALAESLKRSGVEIGYVPRQALLSEIYPRTRVIVLPSMMDTVGYSVLEAMFYGAVPVVSDHFAMPELVGDAGMVVRAPTGLWRPDSTPNIAFRDDLAEGPFEELTESLLDRLHQLLSDDGLWLRLSERCMRRLRSPPLSLEHRNLELRRVYEEASA
jgi:glycosyltransferase involved in cell wall biosynthesis